MRRLEFMIQHGSFRLDEYESYNNSQKSAESLQTLLYEFYPDLDIGQIERYDNSTLEFSNSTVSSDGSTSICKKIPHYITKENTDVIRFDNQ